MLTVDILICTINEGLLLVPSMLMKPLEGVRYVVSVQQTSPLPEVPMELREREDVTISIIEGRGLSRNRNNAILNSTADIMVVADDDCRYNEESIALIRDAYTRHPDAAIICFKANDYDDVPMKKYPSVEQPLMTSLHQGHYVSSVEVTMQRMKIQDAALSFDTRFGIGSGIYPFAEEAIFICDAADKGLEMMFVPETIVKTERITTGSRFADAPLMQTTKGIVFTRIYGRTNARIRSVKEGLWYLVHQHRNPLPIIKNMLKGTT